MILEGSFLIFIVCVRQATVHRLLFVILYNYKADAMCMEKYCIHKQQWYLHLGWNNQCGYLKTGEYITTLNIIIT